MVICAFGSGCAVTQQSTASGVESVPGETVVDELDLDVETDLDADELGVEAIFVMSPGTGRQMPGDLAPGERRRAVRHILSAATPMGRADMFSLQVLNQDSNGRWMECEATTFGHGWGMGCSELGDVVQLTGVSGSSGTDDGTLVELRGPTDTSYFIMESGGARYAVVPVEGRAVFFYDGACPTGLRMESAWVGDTEVEVANSTVC